MEDPVSAQNHASWMELTVNMPDRICRNIGTLLGAVRRGAMDPDRLRGDPARTKGGLHPRPVPCPRMCVRRGAGRDAGRGQTKEEDGLDQGEARHQTGRPSHLQTEAAPPVWSVRGLHPLLRGQQGPNALRPLPEARLAGRIRHRGKCLQAHCREPVQRVGMPLVETGANVVLAIRCCLENMRWPDFLDWRACSKAAA